MTLRPSPAYIGLLLVWSWVLVAFAISSRSPIPVVGAVGVAVILLAMARVKVGANAEGLLVQNEIRRYRYSWDEVRGFVNLGGSLAVDVAQQDHLQVIAAIKHYARTAEREAERTAHDAERLQAQRPSST